MRSRQAGATANEETTAERFHSSGPDWWAWLDLNQRPHPYQGSAPGPVSAGSRLQPVRTTYRWRPPETVADRSVPLACGPNVDQGSVLGRAPM